MIDKIKEFSTWLGIYNNTIKFITGCVIVISAATAYLAIHVSPWFVAGGAALVGIGVGIAAGITIHRSYANRRNAPLGYRLEKVWHDFRLDSDDPRIFHRVITRQITSKRDQLYIVDGRVKSDADEVRLVSSDPQLVAASDHRPNELSHYLLVFERELGRGDSYTTKLAQDFIYTTKICDAGYVHTTAIWAHTIVFALRFPSEYVQPNSVHMYETDGQGRGSRKSRELKTISHDEQSGLITASVRNPKIGYRYEIDWKWTSNYHEAVKVV